MKKIILPLIIFFQYFNTGCSSSDITVQEDPPAPTNSGTSTELYFPATDNEAWETVSIDELEWDRNALDELELFLEESNTKGFIILKNGRIAVERYFNGASALDNLPWYSTGKTLTAFTTGIAQQEGYLGLSDPSSDYLGSGWSSLSNDEESNITIWNHLTMTTGLDYNVNNTNCTIADCLNYLNDPGDFWYYHNAAYTLIQDIIEGAIDDSFTIYFDEKLRDPIGMQGEWIQLGFASVYFSNPRSMARFGLLNLNRGIWNNEVILNDELYFDEMTSISQNLNEAYGYLWWLNNGDTYRLPGTEMTFSGKLIPSAPSDLIAGLGKDDQKLYVIPSEGLVIVRMGDSGGASLLGPSGYDEALWQKINAVIQ